MTSHVTGSPDWVYLYRAGVWIVIVLSTGPWFVVSTLLSIVHPQWCLLAHTGHQ